MGEVILAEILTQSNLKTLESIKHQNLYLAALALSLLNNSATPKKKKNNNNSATPERVFSQLKILGFTEKGQFQVY